MKVVRFLERDIVIKFFGAGLILAPFVNILLHMWVVKNQNHLSWGQVNVAAYLKSGNMFSYFLAAFSVFIGVKMFTQTLNAWRYVLSLIGAHLLIQIVNVNNKAWQGPLAWPSFILNAALFFFIIDQLVWKVKAPPARAASPPAPVSVPLPIPIRERHVINLKSYRKILFSFGSTKPWGELKTLSSEELSVKSIDQVPENIADQTVQINFDRDVVVDIQYSRHENGTYYFKPLNMDKDKVIRLNQWLRKIAV